MIPKPHRVYRKSKRHRYIVVILLLVLLFAVFSSNSVRDVFSKSRSLGAMPSLFGFNENASENSRTRKFKRGPAAEKKHPFEILPRAEIRLLKAGVITDEAARALEFTDTERVLTQNVIDKHFHEMQAEMAPTVKTTEEDNATCFFIPALNKRGERQIESFQNDLAAVLGEDRAKKSLLALPVDEYCSGFGQFDTYIRVTSRLSMPIENRPKNDPILIQYVNPATGKVIVRRETTWELGSQWFPGLFEIQSN